MALREPLLQFSLHTVMTLVSFIFFAVVDSFHLMAESIAGRIAWTQSWDKFIFITEGGISQHESSAVIFTSV